MKNKLHRLPKWLRLALLLVLMGLMVLCIWLEAFRPALSPRGALRQAEQQGLLEYGEFLTHRYEFPGVTGVAVDYFTAVSRTKGQLHLTEVRQDGMLWKPNERVLAVPIEEPVTALLLPWQVNIESWLTAYPAVFVYCPGLEVASIQGSLTINGETFASRMSGEGGRGCWLLAFESLYEEESEQAQGAYRRLWSYYHLYWPSDDEIAVQITLYDQNGGILAERSLEYPQE